MPQRSASLIQTPMEAATTKPAAMTGHAGGHCVNWLAHRIQSTKQPTAMTYPPTSEAMLRLRGVRWCLVASRPVPSRLVASRLVMGTA